jgi:hypothetical protein
MEVLTMPNPMDIGVMQQVPATSSNNLMDIIQRARQNPRAFEEQVRQMNPQAYQQAMQIRNSANPQALIMQMAKSRGINPGILQMLGIH